MHHRGDAAQLIVKQARLMLHLSGTVSCIMCCCNCLLWLWSGHNAVVSVRMQRFVCLLYTTQWLVIIYIYIYIYKLYRSVDRFEQINRSTQDAHCELPLPLSSHNSMLTHLHHLHTSCFAWWFRHDGIVLQSQPSSNPLALPLSGLCLMIIHLQATYKVSTALLCTSWKFTSANDFQAMTIQLPADIVAFASFH